jgi:hypothetical protein
MNERIQKLHSQCKVCDKDTLLYFDYERFAQLIIIDVCNTLSAIPNDDRIKKTSTEHMTKLFDGIMEHVSDFLKEKYNV